MSEPTRLVVGPGESDNEKFGDILRQLRMTKELSRAVAAARIGVSSEYLRLIEKGQRTPAAGLMPHLLRTYDVEFLLGFQRVIFENHEVKFTSRIQEARQKKSSNSDRVRNVLISEIVNLLATVDDDALYRIYKTIGQEISPEDISRGKHSI